MTNDQAEMTNSLLKLTPSDPRKSAASALIRVPLRGVKKPQAWATRRPGLRVSFKLLAQGEN
jgi:hypothetical protein